MIVVDGVRIARGRQPAALVYRLLMLYVVQFSGRRDANPLNVFDRAQCRRGSKPRAPEIISQTTTRALLPLSTLTNF